MTRSMAQYGRGFHLHQVGSYPTLEEGGHGLIQFGPNNWPIMSSPITGGTAEPMINGCGSGWTMEAIGYHLNHFHLHANCGQPAVLLAVSHPAAHAATVLCE